MRFTINRASKRSWNGGRWPDEPPCRGAFKTDNPNLPWAIEITTLEEVIALIKEVNAELIIWEDHIKIYDDHIE